MKTIYESLVEMGYSDEEIAEYYEDILNEAAQYDLTHQYADNGK